MKSKTSLVAFLSVGHKRAAKALCLFICANELTIFYRLVSDMPVSLAPVRIAHLVHCIRGLDLQKQKANHCFLEEPGGPGLVKPGFKETRMKCVSVCAQVC